MTPFVLKILWTATIGMYTSYSFAVTQYLGQLQLVHQFAHAPAKVAHFVNLYYFFIEDL